MLEQPCQNILDDLPFEMSRNHQKQEAGVHRQVGDILQGEAVQQPGFKLHNR